MPGTVSHRADLHTHSTASDGLDSPASLVELASERGISVLALTDHDTVGGVAEARESAAMRGLTFISGVEFSIRARRGQTHILGYGIDENDDQLSSILTSLRRGRQERGVRIVERLREIGVEVPPDVVEVDEPEHAPGRPHIARALVDAGVVATVSEAFDKFLAAGRPAFVPRRTLTASEAIRTVHDAGGLAVLAHPFSVDRLEEQLESLVAAGLNGLEVYYGAYDQDQRRSLEALAKDYNLLTTGGSDYHGERGNEERTLGAVCLPDESLETLINRLK